MTSQSATSGFTFPALPIALGIQLGSSSYRLTYLSPESSTPAVLLDCFGNETTPAYFAVDGDVALYGDDARSFASLKPNSCIKGVVKSFSDISALEGRDNSGAEWDFCNEKRPEALLKRVTQRKILTKTVEHLVDGVSHSFEQPITITSIVASVSYCYLPAVTKMLQTARNKESQAGNVVPKVTLVPKTMAAFVGYTMNRETCDDGLYAVLFAGASVSEIGMYEVTAETVTQKGDIRTYPLGGDHFDEAILKYCCKEFENQQPVEWAEHPDAVQRLQIECQKAKDRLSAAKAVVIEIPRLIGDKKLRVQVRRTEVENAMEDQVTEFSKWLVERLAPVASSLKGIILVGGASRIPRLQSEVMRLFPGLIKSSVQSCAHVLVSNGCAYLARYIGGLNSERLVHIHAGCLYLNAIKSAEVTLLHESAHATDEETPSVNQRQQDRIIHARTEESADSTAPMKRRSERSSLKDSYCVSKPDPELISVELQLRDTTWSQARNNLKTSQKDESEYEEKVSTDTILQNEMHTARETEDHLVQMIKSKAASHVEGTFTNTGMVEIGCGTKKLKFNDVTRADESVSDLDPLTKSKVHSEETEMTNANLKDSVQISSNTDCGATAAKETCTKGQTTDTSTMTSDRCESPGAMRLPQEQWKNERDTHAGGVGLPTAAFEETAIFRQLCNVEERILPRNGKELWVRSRYSAQILINRCTVPGPSRYFVRLMPCDTMTEPIWLSFNQVKNVQRGNKATESVFQVAEADPRGLVQISKHQLFVKLIFFEVTERESFLRAVQQCTYF